MSFTAWVRSGSTVESPVVLLESGTRLGPCEILGLIGAGGMGQVYARATPGSIASRDQVLAGSCDGDARAAFCAGARHGRAQSSVFASTRWRHLRSTFIVMEHVDDRSLLTRRRRDCRRRSRAWLADCGALAPAPIAASSIAIEVQQPDGDAGRPRQDTRLRYRVAHR